MNLYLGQGKTGLESTHQSFKAQRLSRALIQAQGDYVRRILS